MIDTKLNRRMRCSSVPAGLTLSRPHAGAAQGTHDHLLERTSPWWTQSTRPRSSKISTSPGDRSVPGSESGVTVQMETFPDGTDCSPVPHRQRGAKRTGRDGDVVRFLHAGSEDFLEPLAPYFTAEERAASPAGRRRPPTSGRLRPDLWRAAGSDGTTCSTTTRSS